MRRLGNVPAGAALALAAITAVPVANAAEPAPRATASAPAADASAAGVPKATQALEAEDLAFLEFLGSDDVALEMGEYLARTEPRTDSNDSSTPDGSDRT